MSAERRARAPYLLWLAGIILIAQSAVAAAAGTAVSARAGTVLRPFTSTYAVEWSGITAGTASLELIREDAGRFVYRSRIEAGGLFRLVFPDDISQSSTFVVEEGAVRTLEYHASDGDKGGRRDINLEFNSHTGRITGSAERNPVDIPLTAGTLDPMSVQIAMMRTLESGAQPTHFLMIDKNEIKDYLYAPEGAARIQTALGKLDTVIWSSSRPDSDRVTRMWYAPSLGYLPVRAEQTRSGKLQLRMLIRSVSRH